MAEPGGARAVDPEHLAEAERYARSAVANHLHRIPPAFLAALLGALDEARVDGERLREECNATSDSAIEAAAQRTAALAVCRDLHQEVELLRGQPGSWDSARAVWDAITRIRKALGGDTDV